MRIPKPSASSAEGIQFAWLLRLRWVAIGGQLLVFAAVELALGMRLPWLPLVAVVGFEAATNLLGHWVASRKSPTEGWLTGLLAVDVLLLTALLYLTGGPLNPFSFLYMVHVALAAATLQPRSAWLLACVALAGFGALFVLPAWDGGLPSEAVHSHHLHWHLYGMYVAFAVSALFVVYFVARVQQALAQREAELEAARDLAQRQIRFASLATMAAGAAHELGTPLSTIAVAAKELERSAAQGGAEWIQDVRLIRQQVRRCQEILQQMAVEAGNGVGEAAQEVEASELLAGVSQWGEEKIRVRVHVAPEVAGQRVSVPVQALRRALRSLVKNAVQASTRGNVVEVGLSQRNGQLCLEVRDCGAGMPAEVLAHAGEPFFTTKPPGQGIGLGLFLARSTMEQIGGRLELESATGQGTVARLVLPAGNVCARNRWQKAVAAHERGEIEVTEYGRGSRAGS